MGSDKGVLARAIAGGFKGGNAALRQKDELTEKFLWGNEEARQARNENHARFGEAKQLATHASNLGVGAAQQTRKLKRDEGIAATQSALRSKMEYLGSSPEIIEDAMDFIGSGGAAVEWTGKPGEALTSTDADNLSSAIEKLMPNADDTQRMEVFKVMEANRTAGTPGLPTKKGVMEETAAMRKQEKQKQAMVTKSTDKIKATLASNPAGAVIEFKKLFTKRPDLAQATLLKLEAEGANPAEVKAMKRILAGKDRGVMPDRPFIQVGDPSSKSARQRAIASIPPGDTDEF